MSETAQARPKRCGNYKPGPGRPKGRKNNRTLELEAAAREAAAAIDEAFEGDAHAFLQAVYRNPAVPLELRIMAASRALKVEKPALSAGREQVDVSVNLAARMEAAQRRIAENAHRERGSIRVGPFDRVASRRTLVMHRSQCSLRCSWRGE